MRLSVITAYPPFRGNLSEYAKALIDEMVDSGQIESVHIITNTNGRRRIVKERNVTLHYTWRMKSLIGPLRAFLEILRTSPSLVLFNVHLAVFGWSRVVNFTWSILPRVLRLFGYKVVVTLHNLPEKVNLQEAGLRNSALNRLGLTIATKFYTLSDFVVVTMKSYVKLIQDKYKGRVVYIPHGAWTFGPKTDGSNRHVLFLGYVGPYKDVGLLLDAFRLLNRDKPNIKLFLTGSVHPNFNNSKILGKAELRHYVSLTGYVPDEELPSILKDISIIALPYGTCTGTSGVAHLLAAFGKPFVATALPEFVELKEEGAGILTAERDPMSFYKAMKKLLEDKELYGELSRKNIEFANQRKWSKISDQYIKLFTSLTDGKT